jgi:hypothetical protein
VNSIEHHATTTLFRECGSSIVGSNYDDPSEKFTAAHDHVEHIFEHCARQSCPIDGAKHGRQTLFRCSEGLDGHQRPYLVAWVH